MFRGKRLRVLSYAHNNYLSLCETCTPVKKYDSNDDIRDTY